MERGEGKDKLWEKATPYQRQLFLKHALRNLHLPALVHRGGIILCCNQAFARFTAKTDACNLCKLSVFDVIPWGGDWAITLADVVGLKEEWETPTQHHLTFSTETMELLVRVDVWPVTWNDGSARLAIGEPVEVTEFANEEQGMAKPYIMGGI